jgi:membrane fusion protein (multidrug efflux system)
MSEETAVSNEIKETAPAEPDRKKGNGGKQRAGLILLIILLLGGGLGLRFWVKTRTHITTDDAFVESHVHAISSRVPGVVMRVAVTDNQYVQKGDLLLELDPADYQARQATATAALEMARNETSSEYAEADSAGAVVGLERARLEQADADLTRGRALFAKEVMPREQLEKLETARKVAALKVREAEEALRKAEAAVGLSGKGSVDARVAQRQAQLAETELSLIYTKVYAPADGFVTRKSVEPGNYVQPGQPVMAVVRLDDVWVTANYKESQLTHVKPGQQVEFSVDAYPGQKFTGTVESIMAGTGAAFSLLPPENATGNYVKVVQRIPVRITVDRKSDPEHHLRIGMSVVPVIMVERKWQDILWELNPFQ